MLSFNSILEQTQSQLRQNTTDRKFGSHARSSNANMSQLMAASGSQTPHSFQCHWINKVRFNMAHDQLVLTSDTATFMNLYRFQSVSSAPHILLGDEIFAQSKDAAGKKK